MFKVQLRGYPDDLWIEKAKAALNAGYDPAVVAEAVFGFHYLVRSDVWVGWIDTFDRLQLHADPQIRRIGQEGKAKAVAFQKEALEQERKEEIYGI